MEFRLPELGEGVYEAEMVRWLVKAGESVKPGQALLEVLTDKATMEVPAPFSGVLQNLLVEPGQKLKIGQDILTYGSLKTAPSEVADKPKIKPSPTPIAASPKVASNGSALAKPSAVKAAPSVRLMARKLGIDLQQVQGSGPGGRVLVEDLSRHVTPSRELASAPVETAADFGKPGTRIKLQGLRRKIAEHMVLAKRTIPHYTYVDECNVTDLVRLRESLKESFARKNAKITYLAFLVKAVVAALKEVPIVNSTLDDQAGEIVLHDQYHIGVAVATSAGLIVPVVRDADKKTLIEIAGEVSRISNAARLGKSRLEDLRGGTFTITSIGNLGGLFATPIIPHPQVAIVGVGKIVKRPIFDEHGQIKAADIVYLSWSFDHRVLDGAVGTAFGNAMMRQLQNPAALLVD